MRKRLSESLPRTTLAVIFFFCFGATKAYAVTSATTPSPSCGSLSTKSVISPNGAWKAVVHENYCEGNYVFQTWATYTVTLIARSGSPQQADVYAVDDSGNPQEQPAVSWLSNNALQITSIQDPYSAIQKNSFGNITISYAY
jgi:hypothetical protein